jgi:hypothetical protein
MRVPEEFRHLAQCFYKGSDEEVSGLEEWAALALGHLDAGQRKVVKQFLDESLAPTQAEPSCSRSGPKQMPISISLTIHCVSC